MATERQRVAARRNVRKAQQAAREGRTINRLPKETRPELAKQANRVKALNKAR